MRNAADHCQAAYISSLLGSQDMKVQILKRSPEECPPLITAHMLQRLAAKTGGEETIACLQGSTQREISMRIDTHSNQIFLINTRDSGSMRDMARINSLGLANSGSWLNVLPSPMLGLHLKKEEFIVYSTDWV